MTGDILPTIVGIVLVAAAAAFALLPFVRAADPEPVASGSATPDRFDIYRRVLELEFDRDVGKLADEDFALQSQELLAAAGTSLRHERGELAEIDQQIEREIAAARSAFAAVRAEGRADHPSASPEPSPSETAGTPS